MFILQRYIYSLKFKRICAKKKSNKKQKETNPYDSSLHIYLKKEVLFTSFRPFQELLALLAFPLVCLQ